MNIQRLASTLVAASLLLASTLAVAADWPAKPIRLIVPFGPGSTPDLVARIVAEKLTPTLGQPVVVENRPGAGGNIGTDAVAKAVPDGYTLGVTISGPLAANTLLFKKLPYKPQQDLDFITIAVSQPSVLVVDAKTGVSDMNALLETLRQHPGQYNYSSMGTGSISHMAMEAVGSRSETEIVHVPYTGSAQAVTAILAGEVQMAVLPAAAVMPHVQAGKLKAIAVATAKRSSLLPDLPTLSEAGLINIEGDAWIGFIAPAKTPTAITTRLQAEIAKIVSSDEVKKKLATQYMEPVGSTAAQFHSTVKADLERWAPIIKKNNIAMD